MAAHDDDQHESVQQIGGRPHRVHHLKDDAVRVIGTVAKPLRSEFRLADVGQLLVGAFIMALPLAFTEEVWDLGRDLSHGRVLVIFLVSVLTLALFVWTLFYQGEGDHYRGHFLKRVTAAYIVTFCVALFLMILVDKAPLDDLWLTFSRTVIVAFPASFSATAVDFVK